MTPIKIVAKVSRLFFIFIVMFAGTNRNDAGAVPPTAKPHIREAEYKIDSGDITFLAIGRPGFLRINGKSSKPVGSFAFNGDKTKLMAGEVKVILDSFETGLSLRDRHMKEKYLETDKFPEAVFKADELDFKSGKIPASTEIKGSLTLHGVTHPIVANLNIEEKKGAIEFATDFEIILSDFKVEIPKYAGVTVAEKVKIAAKFVTHPTSATAP